MKPKWLLTIIVGCIAVAAFTILRFFNSASDRSYIAVAIYVIYIVGGLILAAISLERKRIQDGWARLLFVCTAVLLIFIGASELLRHYRLWSLPPQAENGFSYTLILFRGVVLGFLLALTFSGELGGSQDVATRKRLTNR